MLYYEIFDDEGTFGVIPCADEDDADSFINRFLSDSGLNYRQVEKEVVGTLEILAEGRKRKERESIRNIVIRLLGQNN